MGIKKQQNTCEGERFLAGIFFLWNAHILHMTYYTLGAYLQMH